MRLIPGLLATCGLALFGSAAALDGCDAYLALVLEKMLVPHAAHTSGGSVSAAAEPPEAAFPRRRSAPTATAPIRGPVARPDRG